MVVLPALLLVYDIRKPREVNDGMGKRIVITSFGSYGDVYPYIGLGLELKRRGHDPVLATSAYYRDAVEREGLSFHPVRPDIGADQRDVIRQVMDPAKGTEYIVREMIGRPLKDTYADVAVAARGADLIVTHPITFAAVVFAERERTPWVSTVLAPISFFSSFDFPVFPPAPWTKRLERIPGVARLLVGMAKQATKPWMETIHTFRRQMGLPRGGNPLFEGQHSPRAVLALFSRVLAKPQPDWPGNVHVTGAVAYNGPEAGQTLAPEIVAFLEAGPAPVVFTLGTSAVGVAGNFYETSVDAVRRIGQRAVMLVGPYPENRPQVPLRDDILVLESVPHAALFRHAAAVVHQGGAGTMHQVLRAGKPAVIVPFAHDQPDNAHRLTQMGLVRTITPRRYRSAKVAAELQRLLDDERYRVRAQAVATRVRAENGAHAASDVIESVF